LHRNYFEEYHSLMKRLLTVGVSFAALAALVAAGTVAPAPAATSGLAFDSVTKFKMGGDSGSAEPGTFEADFEQAAQARKKPPSHGGGMFGGINAAMEAASGAASMLQNGSAQRHYIAGSLERTDDIAAQTATITDCSARTLTTLDLANKTYRIESLDKPLATPGPREPSKPQPEPTDDGTKVSMVVTTTSLGPRKIGPDPTNGYDLDVKITTTKPTGASQTSEMSMISYYSNYANPHTVCSRYGGGSAERGPGAGAMAAYGSVMRGLMSGGKDARFKVSSSGPALPAGKLSLFDVFGPKAQSSGNSGGAPGGFGMLMERGHVHGITDADPAFSVPADFKKLP
jgi:hypothetical protein